MATFKRMLVLLIFILGGIGTLHQTWGQKSGGTQPEFSKFTPVSTSNLVNPFTGDFQYNIPLVNIPGDKGSGYALSLSYDQNQVGPEQEASWVGFGWTLNPGAIIHQINGFSDDSYNTEVTYWNKDKANITVSLDLSSSVELLGLNPFGTALSKSGTFIYNSKNGFHFSHSIGLNPIRGINTGYKYSSKGGDQRLFFQLDPFSIYNTLSSKPGNSGTKQNTGDLAIHFKTNVDLLGSSQYLFYGDQLRLRPSDYTAIEGVSFRGGINVSGRPSPLPVGLSEGIGFTYARTESKAVQKVNTYGFLYSNIAKTDPEAAMDYVAERNIPFHVNNPFLSIPQMAKDNYIVTGEGVVGNLKLYSRTTGVVRPAQKASSIPNVDLTIGGRVGTNFGLKGAAGVSVASHNISEWKTSATNSYQFPDYTTDEDAYFFRFNGDLGGNVLFGETLDKPAQASLTINTDPTKIFDGTVLISEKHLAKTINKGERSGRSSNVIYHTNQEILDTIAGSSVRYQALTKDPYIDSLIDRSHVAVKHHIGEISIVNENGQRYTYGLPVYGRNTYELQYGLADEDFKVDILNNHLAYMTPLKTMDDIDIKKGIERKSPEPITYLLTLITTPDYRDLTNNGPTEDDLGGYTRFEYKQLHGASIKSGNTGKWYNYRSPYTGLYYHQGEVSSAEDDMGSVSGGEKEIYYLSKIETRTHYALFITSMREDGIEAAGQGALRTPEMQGTSRLHKLDRVEIYAKGRNGEPDYLLQTTYFKYDYSLMNGVEDHVSANRGRLTLKATWTEYEGITPHEVAPTTFSYQYPASSEYAAHIAAKYPEVTAYADEWSLKEQNPDYLSSQVDRWGRYQLDATEKYNRQDFWVEQKTDASKFDPAAWQLKQIGLPSGAKIQIQYEQDDYAYVEDKAAHVMAKVSTATDTLVGNNKFYLDIEDLGYTNTPSDRAKLYSAIQAYYQDKSNLMFYDIVYALQGTAVYTNPCLNERIQAYATVDSVGQDSIGVYVVLLGEKGRAIRPYQACINYVKDYKLGKLDVVDSCSTSNPIQTADKDDARAIAYALYGAISGPFGEIANEAWIGGNCCKAIRPEHSYLRIPVLKAKKGGGLRVKRLLTYDKGITPADAKLYGTAYHYETEQDGKWISSGVATNEPAKGRSENILVQPLINSIGSSAVEQFVFPTQRIKREGPLGEAFRPGASVGYAKVMTKPLHHGPSNAGYSVYEYYTAKDFPVEVETTQIDKFSIPLPSVGFNVGVDKSKNPGGSKSKSSKNDNSWSIGFGLSIDKMWASQGYLFRMNDMHGKIRATRDYSYKFDPNEPKPWKSGGKSISSQQEFEYYLPQNGGQIPIMNDWDKIVGGHMGVESEFTMEAKQITDIEGGGNLGLDFSISSTAPLIIPFTGFSMLGNYKESSVHTNVINSIVRYRSVLKKVSAVKNGIRSEKHFLGYNPYNGKALVTSAPDEYDGLEIQGQLHEGKQTTYRLPANYHYEAMGQEASNQGAKLKSGQNGINLRFDIDANGKFYLDFQVAKDGACEAGRKKLGAGDLVLLTDTDTENPIGLFHVSDEVEKTRTYLYLAEHIMSAPLSGAANKVDVEVIKSGKTNELNANIASLLTYGKAHQAEEITTLGIDDVQYIERTRLAGQLTDALGNARAGVSFPIPEGLMFSSNGGPCDAHCLNTSCNIRLEVGTDDILSISIDVGECAIRLDSVDKVVKFGLDEDKDLVYYLDSAECFPIKALPPCFQLCPTDIRFLDGIIEAQATTFKDNWPYNDSTFAQQHTTIPGNVYEKGEKGNWRAAQQFNYANRPTKLTDNNGRTWNTGIEFNVPLFNHKKVEANDTSRWINTNTYTAYSPYSAALEEYDAFGIYSTKKFGYHNTVPYLVATNADYESVHFESFEMIYGNDLLEDGLQIPDISSHLVFQDAHSGSFAYRLHAANNHQFESRPFTLSQQMLDDGMSVKAWVKGTFMYTDSEPIQGVLRTEDFSNSFNVNFFKLAQVGEWYLYEAKVLPVDWHAWITPNNSYIFSITATDLQTENIIIDDFRLQPLSAMMSCMVYDRKTLRLIADFNAQHFGNYYRYNAKGQLARKIMETERGFKTLQEQHYNVPKVERSSIR